MALLLLRCCSLVGPLCLFSCWCCVAVFVGLLVFCSCCCSRVCCVVMVFFLGCVVVCVFYCCCFSCVILVVLLFCLCRCSFVYCFGVFFVFVVGGHGVVLICRCRPHGVAMLLLVRGCLLLLV